MKLRTFRLTFECDGRAFHYSGDCGSLVDAEAAGLSTLSAKEPAFYISRARLVAYVEGPEFRMPDRVDHRPGYLASHGIRTAG